MDKSMKCLYVGVWSTIISAWLTLLYVGYLAYYPFKVIEFNDPTFPVVNNEVKPGENLLYIADACKYMEVPGSIARSFVNDLIYNVEVKQSNRKPGCNVDTIVVEIPEDLPEGEYKLRTIFNYKINPIRTITYTRETEMFNVVNE